MEPEPEPQLETEPEPKPEQVPEAQLESELQPDSEPEPQPQPEAQQTEHSQTPQPAALRRVVPPSPFRSFRHLFTKSAEPTTTDPTGAPRPFERQTLTESKGRT